MSPGNLVPNTHPNFKKGGRMRRYTLLLAFAAIICALIFVSSATADTRAGPERLGILAKADTLPNRAIVATEGAADRVLLRAAVPISPSALGPVAEIRWHHRAELQGRGLRTDKQDAGSFRGEQSADSRHDGAARYPLKKPIGPT